MTSALQREMAEIARGLPSKSEKIRRLGAKGYTRQQIADFLGIRYQHVRNVLIDAEKRTERQSGREPSPAPSQLQEETPPFRNEGSVRTDVDVSPDGTFTIPSSVMAASGFRPGDGVTLLVKAEGRVELLSAMESIRHAQELVARYIPKDVSLVETLFEMRREEVEMEEREFQERKRQRER